ncbi:hypothetical protein PULV_a1047 [Pseudoalteromonas ulvae UL12]|uniref:OmpA-like domain-containing protein n=1 Tax=Pseudoalteromonas ulvae TaxID=107327 RepID=A0A244CS95_PSEDV|nr:OmpA family protein [Pseudoalteromonas ulvae]MBE0363584.1 hypothetical protein [Pseudoalteromonas ulvae UL12]OUL58448.1 hypothetical protein B1199_08965 [Pseudoalteromonas ulvae]
MLQFSYLSLAIGLMLYSVTSHGAVQAYSANPENSTWFNEKTTRLSCELAHAIPYYGQVIFTTQASKAKPLNFTVDMLIQPEGYSMAAIKSVPPPWKPGYRSTELASLKLLQQFDAEAENKTAWLMLSELEKGNMPTLYYQDWRNEQDKVKVALSAVNFRDNYLKFLQCRDQMLAYNFEDIAFTVLSYQKNSSELTKQSKKRLNKIGEYLKNDPNIESVLIAAYTDSYGGRYLNDELSKKRALSIKNYMTEMGVEDQRVEVEGFGEKRHISPNSTVLGRQLNRRVVIQIAKQ